MVRTDRMGGAGLAVWAALLLPGAGLAQTAPPAETHGPHVLVIAEPITRATRDRILAHDPSDIRVVSLDSAGGSVKDAIAIGTWIRAHNIRTHVPAGAECASACTIVFQSGVVRSAHPTARFMYHYASIASPDPHERQRGRVLGTVMYIEALIRFGAPESLYRLVPGDRDWELTADQARKYRLVQTVALDETGLGPE